jgi:hypothetical protein
VGAGMVLAMILDFVASAVTAIPFSVAVAAVIGVWAVFTVLCLIDA